MRAGYRIIALMGALVSTAAVAAVCVDYIGPGTIFRDAQNGAVIIAMAPVSGYAGSSAGDISFDLGGPTARPTSNLTTYAAPVYAPPAYAAPVPASQMGMTTTSGYGAAVAGPDYMISLDSPPATIYAAPSPQPAGYSTTTVAQPRPRPLPAAYAPPPAPPMPAPSSGALVGTSWTLTTLNGAIFPGAVTAVIESEMRFGGRAPCNAYAGDFIAYEDFTLDIRNVTRTLAACPQLDAENAYFDMLSRAVAFRPGREGDSLALLDATGVTIAVFARSDTMSGGGGGIPTLSGDYRITGIYDSVSGFVSRDPRLSGLRLSFDSAAGRFNGNGGCNDIFGGFVQAGASLRFLGAGMTRRACFAPAPFEDDLARNVLEVSGLRMSASAIDLVDAHGAVLIRLER